MSNLCPLDFRYGRMEMKSIFEEQSRLQYQMDVEAALARAHARLGNIPQEAALKIIEKANLNAVSIERVKEIEMETRHDVMALVKALSEQCGEAGKYVHLGATSNDIVDTATAMQIKAAMKIIQDDIEALTLTLADLAKRERNTLQVGRTHAQFAIPITYGFKIAGYISELLRHHDRLIEVRPRACAGKMAGAVGTGAALGNDFLKIQEMVMDYLGITYELAATQVVGRDRYSELICLLANIATSCERFATEVRNLQRSEIGEVSESFDVSKQVGSSTMAQKKNPIVSENICGLARIARGFVTPMFESQILWHERDLSNSSAERFILPHVFTLVDDILVKMKDVFQHIHVDRERMLQNIESAKGLIMAEPVMMALTAKGIGRQEAHEVVREAAMEASAKGEYLAEVLKRTEIVASLLSDEEIDSLMDPANYIGGAPEIVDMIVAEVESKFGGQSDG
ncbi:MAG: adenylosuccinate lyase [Candidatus Methanomethylophilaceae archaeon]|nr:adenylosuccinate lyase [Candidatus Methanomethylophilaceae archaeon]